MAQEDDGLTLRVMRLSIPMPEAGVVLGAGLGPGGAIAGGAPVPKLQMPTALTRILVGEEFTAYLNVCNHGAQAVRDVVVKAEIQHGSSRVMLLNNSGDPAVLDPGVSFDANITHPLREAAQYVIQCQITYTVTGQPAPKVIKRAFRFQAVQAFHVTPSVTQLERDFVAAVRVENASPTPVFLHRIQFVPVDGLLATAVAIPGGEDSGITAADGKVGHYFQPSDTISWLFSVSPTSEIVDKGYLKQIPILGHLQLEWTNLQGGRGTTPDVPVPLAVLPVRPIELRVVDAPGLVPVETSFWLTLDVLNQSDQSISPLLILRHEKMHAIQTHGALTHQIDSLSPGMIASVRLPFFTVTPGLHGLDGLCVLDRVTNQEFEFPGVCSIVVS